MGGDGAEPGLVVAYGVGPGVRDGCCGCRGIAREVFEEVFNECSGGLFSSIL